MRSIKRIIAIITAIACLSISVSACSSAAEDPQVETPEVETRTTDEAESTESETPGDGDVTRDSDAKVVFNGSSVTKKTESNQSENASDADVAGEKVIRNGGYYIKKAESLSREETEEYFTKRRSQMQYIRMVAGKTAKYSDRYNAYTLNLLRTCRKYSEDKRNLLISPLSVFFALAMATNGAREETLAQMENVLGLSVDELNEFATLWKEITDCYGTISEIEEKLHGEGALSTLKTANSAWLKNKSGLHINKEYLDIIREVYNGELFTAAFDKSTVDDINNWIKENTDGLIDKMIDAIPEAVVFILINTLFFRERWEAKFSENVTPDIFTTSAGKEISVPFMDGTGDVYLEDDLSVGMKKYYQSRGTAFVAIMPNEGVSIDEYLNSLDGEKLSSLCKTDNEGKYWLEVKMPQFSSEYFVKMRDILTDMGMTDAFDEERADLSGLGTSEDGNLFVSDVIHKAYIEVDPIGTKAGAATVIMGGDGGVPKETKEVILNRPFIYMIIDQSSYIPLFIGVFDGT